MRIKTSELDGAQLDWAVAKAEGLDISRLSGGEFLLADGDFWLPSENWAQGGPIIEREGICVKKHPDWWVAYIENNNLAQGTTPLIAAMRCYVASKLGEEVEIPEELK